MSRFTSGSPGGLPGPMSRWRCSVAAGFIGAVCLVATPGCGSGSGDDRVQDALADKGNELAGNCPVDWEHTPDPRMLQATEPSYYTRPFFTTCEEGGFHVAPWMEYDPPITEYSVEEMSRRVACLSGKCRDGACGDDVAYIESLVPADLPMEAGVFIMSSEECLPCNQNNALYQACPTEGVPEGIYCDGGEWCQYQPMPHNGPCAWERYGWALGIANEARTDLLVMSSQSVNTVCSDAACLNPTTEKCSLINNVTRVHGTTTITNIPLDGGNCDAGDVGHIMYHGETIRVERATLTMGTPTAPGDELAPHMDWPLPPTPMRYFTCSGIAEIHTVTGRWFKAAWLFHYDPANCDKPCWMAASNQELPVQFGIVELPGDPGASLP